MSDWESVKARLEERATTAQFPIDADIRAVLERVVRHAGKSRGWR